MSRVRAIGVPVLVAVAVVSASGIGCAAATPTIDGAKLEQNITADAARTEAGIASVTCPRDRVAVVDDRFTCAANLAGGVTLTYDVTITSAQGAYTYALTPGQVLDGSATANAITADITTSAPALADAVVTCPASVLAPAGKASFECTLATVGREAALSVQVEAGQPPVWSFSR